MGVPAFFRWLSRKYASIVVHCVEEKPKELGGEKIMPDTSKPNPNDYEFDNLYLDMNGIIHPCCHPEDKPAPKNEDEMMTLIFEYIDRIFSICRPRKLLYMAIDGVAPRAKMNQQRSRRFRASKESVEKVTDMARIKADLRELGMDVPPDKDPSEHFDSNCITPGTPFMFKLAECLRYYVHDRLSNDAGWRGIKVILSDANVPGEGEHKIMDFIRKQRGNPDHDPNTKHCLCGADADLIMLGLATHEPHFTIIREEFKPNQPKPCEICAQVGHEMKECQGLAKVKTGTGDEIQPFVGAEQEFIFIRLAVLRESLHRELRMDGLPFKQDIERAIDDWVFMCFFVGNDFLPHLPSLEIREGGIDRLVTIYKRCVTQTGGYLTDSGVVNMKRAQFVLTELGKVEDEIFKNRRERDMHFRRKDQDRKRRARRFNDRPAFIPGGALAPTAPGAQRPGVGAAGLRQEAANMRMMSSASGNRNEANQQAAAELRAMMVTPGAKDSEQRGQKRPAQEDEEDPEPADEIRLWEDGWKDRYYQSKFDVESNDMEFRHEVARHYARGLCWVLRYYYQGCASWKWYFPFHYAPFASDFVGIDTMDNDFERNTQPFKPMEQLMSVFPAGSKKHLPLTWQTLMTDPESPIIDFYPTDFRLDLNGKKYAWQGVALLPFVDERRLFKAVESVYPDLTRQEVSRNIRGNDLLFLSDANPTYTFLDGIYEGEESDERAGLPTDKTGGLAGFAACSPFRTAHDGTVPSPLPQCPDLDHNKAVCINYWDPEYPADHIHPARMLPGAELPPPALKPAGMRQGQSYRPQIGMTRSAGYRNQGDKDISAAVRFLRHNTDGGGRGGRGRGGRGQYSNTGPPGEGGRHAHGHPPGGYGGRGGHDNRFHPYSGQQQGGRHGGRGGYHQGGYDQGGGRNQGGGYSQGGYSQGGYSQGGYSQGGYAGESDGRGGRGGRGGQRRGGSQGSYPHPPQYQRRY